VSQINTKSIKDNSINASKLIDGTVTNSDLVSVTAPTFKGRITAGSGSLEDLTATQATSMLNNLVGDSGSGGTKGLVPAPAAGDAALEKFLNADGTWKQLLSVNDVISEKEDFNAGAVAGYSFANSGAGTGSTWVVSGTLIGPNRWGAASIATGTTTTGRGCAVGGLGQLSDGATLCEFSIDPNVLSTVTDEYILETGFFDNSGNNTAPTEGVFFRYNRLVSTSWYAVNTNSSTETVTNTAVTVTAGVWTNFKFIINSADSSITFYINNSLVATHTTNIPSGTANIKPAFRCVKSAGTTSVAMTIDYFNYYKKLNTPR
jgi:hypothetical protein